MTDEAIFVSHDPFAMESRVIVLKDNHQEQVKVCSEADELADAIIALSYENNIYNVRIHSPLAFFGEVRRNIEAKENTQYSVNKIKVEIM